MNKSLQVFQSNFPVDNLTSYFHRVNSIPLLTEKEEKDLATRFREEGDLEAVRKLVMSHLRFVVKIARKYSGYGLSEADLIQEGNVGLMKAVKRFDPTVGVRLVSFAVHWIKAEMHEFIIKNWRIVKIATTKAQRKLFFNLRSMKKRLAWLRQNETENIATTLDVKEKTVTEMEKRLYAQDEAFDGYSASDDEKNFSPSQYLEDTSTNPETILAETSAEADSHSKLIDALKQVDARSQDILQCRWLGDKKITLQDLAAKYNVSAERIRQLEKQAMTKIKNLMLEES
jgi:RNA polymerase sigma-32 factor